MFKNKGKNESIHLMNAIWKSDSIFELLHSLLSKKLKLFRSGLNAAGPFVRNNEREFQLMELQVLKNIELQFFPSCSKYLKRIGNLKRTRKKWRQFLRVQWSFPMKIKARKKAHWHYFFIRMFKNKWRKTGQQSILSLNTRAPEKTPKIFRILSRFSNIELLNGKKKIDYYYYYCCSGIGWNLSRLLIYLIVCQTGNC